MNNRRACAIGRRRLEDADVEPEGLACLVPRAHLEVLHPLALLDEAHHVTALIAETVAVDVGAGQHIAARAPEHFLGAPPKDVFFFNNTAPTEIYTLSLHDALPI